MIRTTIFWTHLTVGLFTGLIVFVLCVTGALLAFEKQITDWAERDVRAMPTGERAALLSPEVLLANAAKVETGNEVNIVWSADEKLPVRIRHANQTFVLLNGYTGEVLGRGAESLRGFMRWITQLHVSLVTKPTGIWIIDVGNACFVLLILSGLFLWWPRQWRWTSLRNSIAIRLDARGKARDWNWHNALGFWFLLPLLFMATSGLVLSFRPVDQWWRAFASNHALAAPLPPASPAAVGVAPPSAPGWNDLVQTVRQKYPGWRTITLGNPGRFATQSDVVLTVNMGQPGQRLDSYTVKLDKASNTLLTASGWAEVESGNRARAIARVGHTGEILGFWGQSLAFAGCLAGSVLVYTGFALSWRRFTRRDP